MLFAPTFSVTSVHGKIGVLVYREAVAPRSPGLPRFAATQGTNDRFSTLKGLRPCGVVVVQPGTICVGQTGEESVRGGLNQTCKSDESR